MIDNGVLLYATAASVALVHTVLGPDHYLPFVAMSRAGGWSVRKTVVITLLCGLGHVLSSVVLGLIGIAFGVALFKLEGIERFRGDLAGWLLIAFGLAYFVWGVRRAVRNQPHSHFHAHADGVIHAHEHTHHADHVHVHGASEPAGSEPRLQRSGQSEPGAQATGQSANVECRITNGDLGHCRLPDLRSVNYRLSAVPTFVSSRHWTFVPASVHFVTKWLRGFVAIPRLTCVTPWVLFTIFLFGPCEPLIPILMYAAAKGTTWTVVGVTMVFGVTTLATMTVIVLSARYVVGLTPLPRLHRFGQAIAGLAVFACGVAVQAGL